MKAKELLRLYAKDQKDFSGENLRTNLDKTDFREANVTNARFVGSLGISEALKQDIISRGAIFGDAPQCILK